MSRVLVIGGRDLNRGFALAGVETCVAETPQAASEALARARAGDEYGIVILDDQLAEGLDDRARALLSGSDVPVVITVPGRMQWQDVEAMPRDEYIAMLIRQAIGYQLNIHV